MKSIIVYGFLGSGKTTFIENLLSEKWYERVIVLENESGSYNFDADLLRAKGHEAIELNSGCVCCSLKDNLRKIFTSIESKHEFDFMVIEPSGIASLDDLIDMPGFKVDGIITMVDVSRWNMLMKINAPFYLRQIALSPFIVLTKTDLVQDADRDNVTSILRSVNKHAVISDSKESFFHLGKDYFFRHCENFSGNMWLPETGRPEYEVSTYRIGTFDEEKKKRLDEWISAAEPLLFRLKLGCREDNEGVLFICWKGRDIRVRHEKHLLEIIDGK